MAQISFEEGKAIVTIGDLSFNMIEVEHGSFFMGARTEDENPDDIDEDAEDYDEMPRHEVTLINNYYIGEFPVTLDLFYALMEYNPYYYVGKIPKDKNIIREDLIKYGSYPIVRVEVSEIIVFLKKLNSLLSSQLNGMVFGLPSEEEWEFAARGGNKSKGYVYAGSDDLDEVACWEINPVGMKKPNELGLYDMTGNVLEFCGDRYTVERGHYELRKVAWCADRYSLYSIRGKGCVDYRYYDYGERSFNTGFRLILVKPGINQLPDTFGGRMYSKPIESYGMVGDDGGPLSCTQ